MTTPRHRIDVRGLVLHLSSISSVAAYGTWFDTSGNGINGTGIGGVSCVGGNGSTLDGVNDYWNCGYNTTARPTAGLSLSCNVKSGETGTSQRTIISCTEAGGYSLMENGTTLGSGNVGAQVYIGGTYRTAYVARSSLTMSNWNMLTATYDGTSLLLYVNGLLAHTGYTGGGSISYNTDAGRADLFLGAEPSFNSPSTASNFFIGTLDDAILYNRALSAAEVFRLHQQLRKG